MSAGIGSFDHAVFAIESPGTISPGNITAKARLNLTGPVFTVNIEHDINGRLATLISVDVDCGLAILVDRVTELHDIVSNLRRIGYNPFSILIKLGHRHMNHIFHNGRYLDMIERLFSSCIGLAPHEVMSYKAHGLILQGDKILRTIFG